MKILVLNGSPRPQGNTSKMTAAFKEAAEAAGHDILEFRVAGMDIKGCLACEYCHGKGAGVCVQKDDMQKIYTELRDTEMLVLAAPIYYFTLCAQIQAPIQRMYCVNAPAKVKKMALLCSSYSPNVYDGASAEFRDICNYWHAENTGVVTAKIDEQKTDATRQKIIELVAKL